MEITREQLQRLIDEEFDRALAKRQGRLNEALIRELAGNVGDALDEVIHDLYGTTKKLEQAHELAPEGPAKAIIAGLYSDFFNKVAEFRKYAGQVKALAKKGQG